MTKLCGLCSVEIEAKGHTLYCPTCAKIRRKERDMEKRERNSAIKIERKPIPKPKVSISEQNRKAIAAGMTYGKYGEKYGEVKE